MHRRKAARHHRQPGPGAHQHVICGAPEPHDADAYAPEREFEKEIRFWLRDEDCWVLEHVHRYFHALHSRGADVSRFIDAKAARFMGGKKGSRLFVARRMRHNLDLTDGLGDAVMMALTQHIGRQAARDAVYRARRAALDKGTALRAELERLPEVTRHLNAERLAELVQPIGLDNWWKADRETFLRHIEKNKKGRGTKWVISALRFWALAPIGARR